jgi:hypothetical protein
MNLANLPHTLIITHRKTNQIFTKKMFDTEGAALIYLNEVMQFENNKENFSFVITGPNMYYSV